MGQKLFRGFIVVVTVIVSGWFFWFHGRERLIFHGDALGYYAYLPATFIYHNHKDITDIPRDRNIDPHIITWIHGWREGNKPTPKGYILDQYTYGVALMEAPFFFLAHAWEKVMGGYANGYSASYSNAIKLATFIFALLGLTISYRILRRYFTINVSLVSLALVFLGSNLFWFSIIQAGMAHVPLFLLYALLLLCTIRIYEAPRPARFATLGFVAGLITIIRPTDIICLVIPLLYGVYDRETIRLRWHFFKAHYGYLLIAVLAFFVPVIPQLLYWKMMAGSFLYYSYGDQSFHWNDPHIIEGLLYCKNGWLAYSPIMVFAVAGMFLYKRIQPWAWVTWIIFPVYAYVIYSWYCYNYINGLGSRPMIHLYPLFAISLAAFVAFIAGQRLWAKASFFVVAMCCIVLNLNFSVQQAKGVLVASDSNLTFNLHMFFRDYLEYNDMVTYDIGDVQPDKNMLAKLSTLACDNFDDSVSSHFVADTTGRSKYVYRMDEEDYLPEGLGLVVAWSVEKYSDARWIKVGGHFMNPECAPYRHVLCLSIERNGETLVNKQLSIENKIAFPYYNKEHRPHTILDYCAPGVWDEVFFFVKVPPGMRDGDIIKAFPWNLPKTNIFVDDLCLELYR